MTLMFNPVEFIHRLEKAGLGREAAETIAQAIEERNAQIATHADLAKLATKSDLETAIATGLARQTMQFGVMLGAGLALAVAVIGVVVSAH